MAARTLSYNRTYVTGDARHLYVIVHILLMCTHTCELEMHSCLSRAATGHTNGCRPRSHQWLQAPVSPSGDGWFGHYGMGHWWEVGTEPDYGCGWVDAQPIA